MASGLVWADLDIGELLGQGQAGTVWLARLRRRFSNLEIGAKVVVKRYKHWIFEQPGQMERIVRELQVGRQIKHPNLVETLSLISDPDGRPSLLMRFYEGPTLASELSSRREAHSSWHWTDVVKMLRALAGAIAALHAQGVIHRDIKPGNILFTPDGPVLCDLGVVRTDAFVEHTTTSTFLGTIRYAAPEYLFGEEYTSDIDVFSLGAIAYELFLNSPFRGVATHWARLVIQASQSERDPAYFHLAKAHGINAAEYLRFLLGRTLKRPRISAEDLSTSLNPCYLKEPFHIIEGRICPGEPFPGLERDLSETIENLSQEARAYLHQNLMLEYWDEDKSLFLDSRSPLTNELERAGLVRHEGYADGDDIYKFGDNLRLAFRYGYIVKPQIEEK
jgi:serine/threonine protein kinase